MTIRTGFEDESVEITTSEFPFLILIKVKPINKFTKLKINSVHKITTLKCNFTCKAVCLEKIMAGLRP